MNKKKFKRAIMLFVLLLLVVRSLPYLAPIHLQDIAQTSLAVEFRDRHNLPLGTILSQDQNHTTTVKLQEISPNFIKAIIAAEDGGFYHHGPLDLKAIARSLVQAIKHQKKVSGASTITMQLARMLEPSPRTLKAKFKEIWLSWRLAAGMNKDEILEAYINRLPMGSNIYGIEAASRIYFNTTSAQLSTAQASLLAAIPNNPNHLSPYDNFDALKKRQHYVINRMVAEKFLTKTEGNLAYSETLSIQPRQQGIIAAPHFLFWLAQKLPPLHSAVITTTLDLELQKFTETQLRDVLRNLKNYNVQQGAALVINNHTGEILTYVGSKDYFADLGNNDGVQALRQPGSALKPFLYQLGLETNVIKANSILADIPTAYAIPDAQVYNPKDYSETWNGPVRIRIALANSLNIPAVRLLEKIGVAKFLDRLHLLGFVDLKQSPEYYGLGLALGSGEVTLWQLAQAYYIMSQQGIIKPFITEQGINSQSIQTIATPTTWELITDMISDPFARAKAFGVDSVLNLPFPVAVKTGTSSKNRDTWTVGFTRDYTVATWVGNFNGEPMNEVSGVTGAAPLWTRIMLHLYASKKDPPAFNPPSGMVKRPICALSGLKPTPACPSVVEEYFNTQDLTTYEAKLDSFYQKTNQGVELNLPRQYDEWLAKQTPVNLNRDRLKIISPNSGDRYLVSDGQSVNLEFKLSNSLPQATQWRLNGETIATTQGNYLFWQVKPGKWTLEAINGDKKDEVNFQVDVAQIDPSINSPKRGFSIKN